MKYLALILVCTGCALSHGSHPEDDAPADTIIVAVYDAQPDRGISFVYDGHHDEDASVDPDVQPDVVAVDPDVVVIDEDVTADVAVDDATDAQADVPYDSREHVHIYSQGMYYIPCGDGFCADYTTELCGTGLSGQPRCCWLCPGPSTTGRCSDGNFITDPVHGGMYVCGY